jgi:Na+/melibiose symporter-like transporter
VPWRKALVVWLAIILAESVHGTLRTLYLAPLMGDASARRLGVLIGSVMIVAIALAFARWLGDLPRRQLFTIGAAWVVLTVAFEIVLGRAVMHASWDRILGDYDLTQGGLMGFGLLVLWCGPWLAHRLRFR